MDRVVGTGGSLRARPAAKLHLRRAAVLISTVLSSTALASYIPDGDRYVSSRLPWAVPPQLLGQKLAAIDFGSDRVLIRSALQAALLGGGWSKEVLVLSTKVEAFLHDLSAAGDAVKCSWDPTVRTNPHGEPLALYKTGPFFLAANLFNSEGLMPHLMMTLLKLTAVLPPDSVYVSIYESNSKDETALLLDLMHSVLTAFRVPHRIVYGAKSERREGDLLGFLANARNVALEPLWLDSAAEVSDELLAQGALVGQLGREDMPGWPPKKVLFMNDAYFCAEDAVRLLLHRADLACGMDYFHNFNAEDEATRPAQFYDNWVTRDADGDLFTMVPPYATDPYSRARISRGLHFPVKCCWNGMVALNAAPFLRHGVRVRTHRPGECASSECSLMCNDFLRLGYADFVLDPGVRVTYWTWLAGRLKNITYLPIPQTTWAEIQAAPVQAAMTNLRPNYRCCPLKEGERYIQWSAGYDAVCQWDNYMVPNYTASSAAEVLRKQQVPHRRKRLTYAAGTQSSSP